MEILSPASNLNHIKVAIDEKANAVYGGLKKWNARNKAINFSCEEYNYLIDCLHEHGIKFYLTLNILMLDEEIKEVVDFLKQNKLPDSFIVADIGLIQVLKKEFPDVPLHFSTQFGAHNCDDVAYIESLGGKRAILARELTLDELNTIQSKTNIELECFVWGSQCLSFSGLCFFGSLINGGGGNRGKCMITCRDMYAINDNLGHHLYVPDMDVINLISKLKNIDCLKIEGRRRNYEEIRSIIKQVKTGISNDNKGYLYGKTIDKNNLYEQINKREMPYLKAKLLEDISKQDICIRYENNTPVEFSDDYNNDDVYYLYTDIKKDYDINKNNVFIELKLSDKNEVQEILLVNHKGDGHTFFSKEDDYITFDSEDMIKSLDVYGINLYKIKYKRNVTNKLLISKNLYNETINYIIDNCHMNEYKFTKNSIELEHILLETSDLKIIDSFINDSFVKIIYNIQTVSNLKNIDIIVKKYADKIIYKLPLFNWTSDNLLPYYQKLAKKEVMFTRLTQLYICRGIQFKTKYTDYSIYIWNHHSLNYLKKYKIDSFTGSFELSYLRNKEIFKNHKYQLILGGRLPLVYTRGCFRHLFNCENCLKNQKKCKSIKNVDKNMNFELYCNEDYRVLLNKNPILNDYSKFDVNDNISFRYVTSNESIKDLEIIINKLKTNDYYNSLKQLKIFKNSYECNLIEGKE